MNDIAPDDPLASFQLDDCLIVVTGASEGIGRVIAERFAGASRRAAFSVAIAARRHDRLGAMSALGHKRASEHVHATSAFIQ